MYIAYEVTLDAVRSLPPLIASIKKHNPQLADQLKRAGQNALLNLAEARRRGGQDRINRFRYFAGEAGEAVAALEIAISWSYADLAALEAARHAFDRALGMTWSIWRPG